VATIRSGDKRVLLVVDVQVGVVGGAWETPRIVGNVVKAVKQARAKGMPVVWIQHNNADEIPKGSDQWQLVPELTPDAGEPIVHKQHESSFEDTNLEEELARLGATHIILAGAATNWCIRATAYGALDRGYDLTLISDAHTTEDMDFGDGKVIRAEDIIDELNTTLKWLSYPGRSNSTVKVVDLDI